jgi:uridine phosphorylase
MKFENANFPTSKDGRMYHVGVKSGELSNRIVTVGDVHRLNKMKMHLSDIRFEMTSKRNFTSVTGKYKGVEVSIVSIGMGYPVMDMFVREVRHVVDGPIHCIRFGSCGSISEAKIGQVCVSDGAIQVVSNPDVQPDHPNPYILSKPCPADQELTKLVLIFIGY